MEQDEIYGDFAYVYDEFMDNIPYEQWHDYLHGLLIKYGVTDGIVADSCLWYRYNDKVACR